MPNDAKLGLVIGVGLVIAVAAVFFRKDLAASKAAAEGPSSVAVSPANPAPAGAARGSYRQVKARTANGGDGNLEGQRHIVKEGETLFSLAQHYYGNEERFVDIYRVNREVVKTPDQLTPGTVLVIPDLGEQPEQVTGQPSPSN